jgi:serine/threonine protein kinase
MNADVTADESLGRLVERLTRRLQEGERLDLPALAREYPEHAAQLAEVWPALQALADLERAASAGGEVLPLAEPEAGPAPGVLGDFRILREVGRGGMGIVYEAEQISLGRRVALKVLPFAATMDPRHLQRFHNEARAAASLDHPHIVKVHAVGCERGVHYYAMQFIDGQTLAAFIEQQCDSGAAIPPTVAYGAPAADTVPVAAARTERGPRDRAYFRRAAEWGIEVAEALEHAHQLGVVHRDVKPANLMIDGRGKLWVADFGLARTAANTGLTMSGDLVGTLRYMSPEQALAKRVVIDHRTDVYSLGATLYELLTLEPAFSGTDRQELLRQIAFEEPKVPRRVNKAIPAELEAIVLKALEKNPADRYATAKELADDLRRWLDGRLIQARPPTLRQRTQKWLRRHPAVVRSAMVVVLLAAMGSATGAWLLWQEQGRTREAWAEAKANETRAVGAAEEATRAWKSTERANEILASIFRDLDPRAEEKGRPTLRVQLGERLNEAARLLQSEPIGDPATAARLQTLLGSSLGGLGQYDKALALLEQARQTNEELLGPNHPDTLVTKNNLAGVYRDQGKYDRAEALYLEVVPALTAKRGAGNRDSLTSKQNLALLYRDEGKHDRAEALFQELVQATTAHLGADDPLTLGCKGDLAGVYREQGKYDRAEALYLEVLPAIAAKQGADHPLTLVNKTNLAVVYADQGKFGRAEALLQEALRTLTAQLGADHPATFQAKGSLAAVYFYQRKCDHAESLMTELVVAETARLGADHPVTLTHKGYLAVMYCKLGKHDRAQALLREVLAAQTARLGAEHALTLQTKGNLAALCGDLHRPEEAVQLLEELVASLKVVQGANHPQTLQAILNLAFNYCEAGRRKEGLALYDEWLPRARAVLPLGSQIRNDSVRAAATAYTRAGRRDKAEPLLRELADLARQQDGADAPPYAEKLTWLGLNLLLQKKYSEAEKTLRESLAINTKAGPDTSRAFYIRSILGAALLGQQKYTEAEPLLLQGYEGLKQRQDKLPSADKGFLPEALERLVHLYDAWGKKDQADRWRRVLEAMHAQPQN